LEEKTMPAPVNSAPVNPAPVNSEEHGSNVTGLEPQNASLIEDQHLLLEVISAVRAAGQHMLERFDPNARIDTLEELLGAIHANDQASLGVLREALTTLRPAAGWEENEEEGGALPPGEWWVTDPVEGNVNHIHGLSDWGVTATLVRDNRPVLTVVYLPLSGDTYSAIRGGGAYQNDLRLRPSAKMNLNAALVGTGQAKPSEDSETHRRIGQSVTAMLEHALVLRVSVPATLQLIHVAAGRSDVFWQYSRVRSGLLAGALLVEEAGGAITDTHGNPWTLESEDFLASAPGLHSGAVKILSEIH
jgi:myo-inositol-1(or 4)-monophosphatase